MIVCITNDTMPPIFRVPICNSIYGTHLCDWLQQVERSGSWDYRRTGYRNLAERLGGIGKRRYDEVFAQAPVQAWFDEYEDPKSRKQTAT